MIPVLATKAVKEADQRTLKAEGISSLQLMERAAERCTERILELVRTHAFGTDRTRFLVVAGMGNNGGDGLAIARLLHNAGSLVRVVRLLHSSKASEDHLANLDLLQRKSVPIVEVASGSELFHVADNEVVIDAMLGIGASGPLNELLKDCVKVLTGRHAVIRRVPTGLAATGATLQEPKDHPR